jgi:hypothetical protein
MKKHENPNDDFNSSKYHTGKKCIENGCDKPAGTKWSPFWCWECNSKRLNYISSQFEKLAASPTEAKE